MLRHAIAILVLGFALAAPRAFEMGGAVYYEDADQKQLSLGEGFSPVLNSKGEVAVIRGKRYRFGDDYDCRKRETKNWITVFTPSTGKERILVDYPLRDEVSTDDRYAECIFQQLAISPDDSVLYVIIPASASSSNLAIVPLKPGGISYVPDVNAVYTTSAGDLIAVTPRGFAHLSATGKQVRSISPELDPRRAPLLEAYLRQIGASIMVNGEKLPR
jgi:hypothetical protein